MYDRNGDMMCLLENKVEEYYKLNGEYLSLIHISEPTRP